MTIMILCAICGFIVWCALSQYAGGKPPNDDEHSMYPMPFNDGAKHYLEAARVTDVIWFSGETVCISSGVNEQYMRFSKEVWWRFPPSREESTAVLVIDKKTLSLLENAYQRFGGIE